MKINDKIIFGDVFNGLNHIKNNSISVVVTSPPYWKQRDYGFNGQIGQEDTEEEYISKLISLFNKLKNKLKDEGIFFLNIGDKYSDKYGKSSLLTIPYKLAYYMTKFGWILEDIIIWYKPNHMPSSVKDRFTNTYEPIFVFSKNKNNIYKKVNNILKISLQSTSYKHTAVFPENLVKELLKKVELNEGDIILDPFAGTGTVGKVVQDLRNDIIFNKNIYFTLIEKSKDFVKIIKDRLKVSDKNIIKIEEKNQIEMEEFTKIEYVNILSSFKGDIIIFNTNKMGEVIIVENNEEFKKILKGMTLDDFKKYHRLDAIYFIGVKNWNIESFYVVSNLIKYGYLIRNIIIVTYNNKWYPVFMIVNDTKKVQYRFYLDRVRINSLTEVSIKEKEFIGIKVKNFFNKKEEGVIENIVEKYEDNFPKIVKVKWKDYFSNEVIIHTKNDENLIEGLKFLCPYCNNLLEEFDPLEKNFCNHCHKELWTSIDNVPIIKEPDEIVNLFKDVDKIEPNLMNNSSFKQKSSENNTLSKFKDLERINWGASPGARKLVNGEYFSKMRLYRVNQCIVATYLKLLIKSKNLTISKFTKLFPENYKYKIGHWFRCDFGGSIPIPDDIKLIKAKLNIKKASLLDALEKEILKFQTVKNSVKGKNPGDFLEIKNDEEIKKYFKKLFLSSNDYLSLIK